MLSSNKKLQIAGACATLLAFALGVGCHGFFVNPTLTGLTVGPTTSIATGSTVQMTAVGTYNDGSTGTVKNVYWSTSDSTIATVNTGGLVKGIGPGQATISGASGTVNGSATITVTLSGITAIKVTSSDGLSSVTWGDGDTFIASATANGQSGIIVTDSVTWSINPTNTNVSISSTGELTTSSSGTGSFQFQVVATDPTSGISGYMSFSVIQ
jgi:hypothetical protein